jgi:hypothetical protein
MDNNEKANLISAYRDIESLAMTKRLEYLTVEIMPESPLKDMKLAKINAERTKLEQDFANVVTELVTNF